MLTWSSCIKMTICPQNCWGATSFRVSTSHRESLLNAKNLHLLPCFHMSLTWALVRIIVFKRFSLCSTMWMHVQACMPKHAFDGQNTQYHKDTEPLYHAFMYSTIILLSSIYPFMQCLSLLVTIICNQDI